MTRDRTPYSRVYWSINDDAKFDGVRENDRLLATWLRLLLAADMAYPAPAFIPRRISSGSIKDLESAGLIDVLPHDRFRIHGLEAERERRSTSASQAASLRWNRPKEDGGKPASRRTRFKVLERDGYRCRYCGRTSDEVALDVDHVKPIREGGTDDLDNLVAACVDCNAGKSGHSLRAHPTPDARALQEETSQAEQKNETTRANGDDGRADLEAFLVICRRAPTPKQRRLLDDVMARHDLTGPAWAADLMFRHPDDPIGAVIEADEQWRQMRIQEAQAAEKPKPQPRRARGLPESTREILDHWAAQAKAKEV